jgi:hypothetical protein
MCEYNQSSCQVLYIHDFLSLKRLSKCKNKIVKPFQVYSASVCDIV